MNNGHIGSDQDNQFSFRFQFLNSGTGKITFKGNFFENCTSSYYFFPFFKHVLIMYIKFNQKINPVFQSPIFKMCCKNARNAITENVQQIRVISQNLCETLIHFRSKWRSLSNLIKQLKIRHGYFYK